MISPSLDESIHEAASCGVDLPFEILLSRRLVSALEFLADSW